MNIIYDACQVSSCLVNGVSHGGNDLLPPTLCMYGACAPLNPGLLIRSRIRRPTEGGDRRSAISHDLTLALRDAPLPIGRDGPHRQAQSIHVRLCPKIAFLKRALISEDGA